MALSISVKHDIKELQKKLDRTQRRQIPKVVSAALNKTRANVVTAVKKDVAAHTGVIQKDIKAALSEDKATPLRLRTSIIAKKRTFNLIRFVSGRQAKAATGLKAKAFGSKARIFRGTFIGNKGRTAFVRKNQADPRSKIRAAHGPSIPRAMVSDKVSKNTRQTIAKRFPINFASQIKRFFPKK